MQRTTIEKTLSPKERAKLRMFAAANGAMDPQGMDDEALQKFNADLLEAPTSAADSGQDQQEGESEEEERDPSDPESFNQQPGGAGEGSEPKPGEGDGDSGEGEDDDSDSDSEPPPEDLIRKIAREEDDWRRDNEIAPALSEMVKRVEALRQGHVKLDQKLDNELSIIEKMISDAVAAANNGMTPAQNITLTVKPQGNAPAVTVEHAHPATETLIRAIGAGVNVLLVGPAGSGKTTLAHTISQALGLDFYFTGAIAMEYKLSGFIDANGVFQDTQFRQAFENGGLFLFDEVDASSAQALLAFNAALANGWADFPDGQIAKHKDFVCLAAANTYGSGADRLYVGRNQLDAASLDRFAVVDMDYDEGNEHNWARAALGLDPTEPKPSHNGAQFAPCKDVELTSDHVDEWVAAVQRWRSRARDLKVRHVISPRASIFGVKLLAAGIPVPTVETMVVWKGLDEASVTKIKQAA